MGPIESSYEFEAFLIIDGEPDHTVDPLIAETTQGIWDLDQEIRLFHGIFLGSLFSVPIWALILWMVS